MKTIVIIFIFTTLMSMRGTYAFRSMSQINNRYNIKSTCLNNTDAL